MFMHFGRKIGLELTHFNGICEQNTQVKSIPGGGLNLGLFGSGSSLVGGEHLFSPLLSPRAITNVLFEHRAPLNE